MISDCMDDHDGNGLHNLKKNVKACDSSPFSVNFTDSFLSLRFQLNWLHEVLRHHVVHVHTGFLC